MKGLLLKDYYLIKSVLFIIALIFAIIGGGISFLTSPWAICIIATIMLGMISVTTINMDKTSGWRKAACVLPVSKKTALDSKYVLYLLLSGIGFTLGMVLSVIPSLMKNQLDLSTILLFASISVAMALLAGSITIPCCFLLSEEKNMVSLLAAYPLSTFIIAGSSLLFEDKQITCIITAVLGILFYALSWILARKFISYRDIT